MGPLDSKEDSDSCLVQNEESSIQSVKEVPEILVDDICLAIDPNGLNEKPQKGSNDLSLDREPEHRESKDLKEIPFDSKEDLDSCSVQNEENSIQFVKEVSGILVDDSGLAIDPNGLNEKPQKDSNDLSLDREPEHHESKSLKEIPFDSKEDSDSCSVQNEESSIQSVKEVSGILVDDICLAIDPNGLNEKPQK